MNILILSHSKSQSGGVERFSFYLQQTLQERGHTVKILGQEDLGVVAHGIIAIKKRLGFGQPALGYFLGRLAKKTGFDVCVTNGMLGWNISNRPMINVQHGTFARAAVRIDRQRSLLKYFIKRYVWGFFEGVAARRASRCVAVSQETKESVETYYQVSDVAVILNSVDTELFQVSDAPKKNQAVFVGRFEYAKGKEILEGMRQYLHAKGWDLAVPRGKSQEELAVIYKESQVFLLPSLHEGCSYALLDAMACGLPFLASPVGLVPELEKAGQFKECIVHEQTVAAYSQAFENLMQKTEQEKALLAAELRRYIITHHSLVSFGNAYEALVREITASHTMR